MAVVADLERLLERVFERTTARLFRAGVQVVQLERRVERAMERARTPDGIRIAVPARYRVRLHPSDLGDVAARAGGAEALAVRLAENALAFARSHGYHLAGRPEIWLVADPGIGRGQVDVDVAARGATSELPARQVAAPAPAPDPAAPGVRGDGTQTVVFRRPSPQAARANLRVLTRDGPERLIEVDGSPLTIGRSRDNRLVLGDASVSRHHGRLQARRGTLVYTDLRSTNGSRVNGIRVDEIVLGEGDRLQVGDTVLVVETLPG